MFVQVKNSIFSFYLENFKGKCKDMIIYSDEDIHVFLSSVENKLRFLRKTF